MQKVSLHKSIIILITCAGLLSGCGAGSGEGLDQKGDPIENDNSLPLADNFASIQENIFTLSCALSGCHSGAAPTAGLLLTAASSFSNLVNVSSNEVPMLNRITPGDADNSYLVQKVEGRAVLGYKCH